MTSLAATIKTIEESLEEYSWLFVRLSQNDNTLALPNEITDFLTSIDLPIWASLYTSETSFEVIITQCIFGKEESSALEERITNLSPQELEPFSTEVQARVYQFFDDIHPDGFDIDAFALQVDENSTKLSLEQHDLKTERNYFLCTNFLLQVFNFLALVTHGRTMYDIVHAALFGCDNSFLQAVQIDPTVLSAIPYFQKRLTEIHTTGHSALQAKLSIAMGSHSIGAKYTYPELKIVFSLLHRTGHFRSMPMEDLLDLCLMLKVYRGDSVKALAKRKSEFLKSQPRPA